MFLVEADYALKYVDSDICLDVRKEVGISESDTANQYKYTQDVMTDSNGILKGLSWQATPGLFLYNADYAKDVLELTILKKYRLCFLTGISLTM